jgi:hypothetical protein
MVYTGAVDPPTDLSALDLDATPDLTGAMVPNLRRLGPNLLVAGVMPVVAYALLRPHVSSDAVALAAVMIFPLGEIFYERHRHGGFEPVGIISLIGIAAGLIGALAMHGDAFVLKVRDSIVTGVFGVVCLVSLPARRPAMFYLGRAFATGGDPAKMAQFELMWKVDGVSRRFRIVTLVWGVGLVGEAVVRTTLALVLSTGIFLVVSQVAAGLILGGLLWWTVRYSRSGERTVRSQLTGADGNVGDGVVGALVEHDVSSPAGGEDVLGQVAQVDLFPDAGGQQRDLVVAEPHPLGEER